MPTRAPGRRAIQTPESAWTANTVHSHPEVHPDVTVPVHGRPLPPSGFALAILAFALPARADEPKKAEPDKPVQLTAQQDHKRMMELLGIKELRRGPNGNPKAPNAANYDESKANPYPNLPDPLV